ncbi:MAG: hypothetical protein JWN23_2011 [Rhodocyclales bacterium]|nr:hypothetical protein [Rhodocyclales bacterium]
MTCWTAGRGIINGTMKRILVLAFMFLFGVAIGYVGCWCHFQRTIKSMVAIGQDMFASSLYNYEIIEAQDQLNNSHRDVAIYALSRAVRNLSSFQAPKITTCRKTAYDLGRFNVRLALLYEEAGNQNARTKHLEKAMASYESMGWILKDASELIKAIPLIDSGKTAEAVKKYGRLTTPCDDK